MDPDWEYLRCHATFGGADLAFEPQGRTSEGKYELIVGPKWPHMVSEIYIYSPLSLSLSCFPKLKEQQAKRNRPNGSYATSDVFELKWSASSALESKWMYVGRKDSLLVLLNGKKFDPVPIEDALQYHPLVKRIVRECLVFGQNRLAPGVLVFTKESCSREECRRLVYEVVKKVNEESPSHARIPISLVQFMNPSCGQLPRSSKGSLIRAKANEQFEAIIGSAYSSKGDISPENNETDTSEPTSSSSVHVVVRATVKGAILANGKPEDQRQRMAERLTDETDLFSFGIDSVMAAEIRGEVQNVSSCIITTITRKSQDIFLRRLS